MTLQSKVIRNSTNEKVAGVSLIAGAAVSTTTCCGTSVTPGKRVERCRDIGRGVVGTLIFFRRNRRERPCCEDRTRITGVSWVALRASFFRQEEIKESHAYSVSNTELRRPRGRNAFAALRRGSGCWSRYRWFRSFSKLSIFSMSPSVSTSRTLLLLRILRPRPSH
jgi:hypothetical protein